MGDRMRGLGACAACVAVLALASAARSSPLPRPDAAAWLVDAPGHGGLLSAHAIEVERPVASLTKLMTAYLVLQAGDLGRFATAGHDAATVGESVVGLQQGERQTRRALLTALVVRSANDAAVDLADAVGGTQSAFVARMNAEARRLGLRHTHYRTPYGLDTPGQFSSAGDVLRLAMLDMRDPRFRADARRLSARIPGHAFPTRNTLLGRYAGLDGVKTGHTNLAGWNLAASAVRDGLRIYVVVLGAPDQARRDHAVARLLDWGFDRFARVQLVRRGEVVARLPAAWRDGAVPVLAARGVARVGRPSDRFGWRVQLPDHLAGPLAARAQVGWLTITQGGRSVGRVPLVTAHALPRPGTLDRVRWLLGRALDDVPGL